jgi:plasmid stabilization system protein ParE
VKKYRVDFSPEARLEALEAAEYIARTSPAAALRWYEGLERALAGLEAMPRRWARAPESEFLGEELRHSLYKSHRIIFRIEEDTRSVRVLHVRHAARRAIGEPETDD